MRRCRPPEPARCGGLGAAALPQSRTMQSKGDRRRALRILATIVAGASLAAVALPAAFARDGVRAATQVAPAPVTVIRPWVRSTRPGQQNAAGYLEVRSATPDRLVGVRPAPDVAERGELHTMRMDGDLMVMREVESFPLAAGRALVLEPGGNHLMLVGIRRPLAVGDSVTAVLVFEKAGEVAVRLEVRDPPPASGAHGRR
jgi:periplasmic copper chaperone A